MEENRKDFYEWYDKEIMRIVPKEDLDISTSKKGGRHFDVS